MSARDEKLTWTFSHGTGRHVPIKSIRKRLGEIIVTLSSLSDSIHFLVGVYSSRHPKKCKWELRPKTKLASEIIQYLSLPILLVLLENPKRIL